MDVVYLDFSKAFDKLDLRITLQKLHNIGICGKLYKWLENFLTGREQKVMVDGVTSERISVLSGVPQGSVVGPLMFLVLLRDIDEGITFSNVSSFADDTRVSSGVSNMNHIAEL